MIHTVWVKFNALVDSRRVFAPAILRYSVAVIFLWFGSQQILHTDAWTYLIPDALTSFLHMSASTLVFSNGIVEVVLAVLLVIGVGTRVVALILAIHLLNILPMVGYSATAVRDFGLAMAAVVVFINGADRYTLEYRRARRADEVQGIHIIN
jgi:uncharacterized membrane protein YphA (DoxX/SURF4 family)